MKQITCVLMGGPLDGKDKCKLVPPPLTLIEPDNGEHRGVKPESLGEWVYRISKASQTELTAAALRRNLEVDQVAIYRYDGWRRGRSR